MASRHHAGAPGARRAARARRRRGDAGALDQRGRGTGSTTPGRTSPQKLSPRCAIAPPRAGSWCTSSSGPARDSISPPRHRWSRRRTARTAGSSSTPGTWRVRVTARRCSRRFRASGSARFRSATRRPSMSRRRTTSPPRSRRRLLPGEGALDLVGLVRLLDARGCDAPMGAEVCSERLAAEPPELVARRVGSAMRTLLTAARRERRSGLARQRTEFH